MEFELPNNENSIIKVIGVGGGGGNAVNHMYKEGIKGVDFVVCNTDLQALDISPVPHKIQLGPSLTEGRGAGSKPEIGKNAAVENLDEIKDYLNSGTKMVFVTAGMGGGTGTGAAPVIAKLAKEMGILTVGIVTVPFKFEGRKRLTQANEGLTEMRDNVDTLLVINNERLREITGNLSLGAAFAMADDVLATAAKGIAEVIESTGIINVDFNDVNTVMKDSGVAIMGSAAAEGDNRAIKAAQTALESPLLNDNDIEGAEYVLLNITYGAQEATMDEISEITDYIQDEAGSSADIIWGNAIDESLGDKISVTVIATGFKTSPITGLEKAPEKKVTQLKDTEVTPVTNTMTTPTEVQATIREVESAVEPQVEKVDLETPKNEVVPEVESKIEIVDEPQVQTSLKMDFDLTPEVEEQKEEESEQVTRLILKEEDSHDVTFTPSETKRVLSAEEQKKREEERLALIADYTEKLKRSEGLQELEGEPAFKRRKINLDHSVPSDSDGISRFSIKKDDNGTSLNSNNSFLHDNVD